MAASLVRASRRAKLLRGAFTPSIILPRPFKAGIVLHRLSPQPTSQTSTAPRRASRNARRLPSADQASIASEIAPTA